jgi:glycosyltransferase involved in cell wall biosynthesis
MLVSGKNMSTTLSVVTIVRNGEKYLSEYMEALLPHVEEIIVVDTGSTDSTGVQLKAYAAQYPTQIRFFSVSMPQFHYGKAKNIALDKATQNYTLILDIDEFPQDNFFPALRLFLAQERPEWGTVQRQDETIPHFVEHQIRLVKTDRRIRYDEHEKGALHEVLEFSAPLKHFSGVLLHAQRHNHWIYNPRRLIFQLAIEVDRTPKDKSFFRHLLRGLWAFQFKFRKVYFSQKVYRDGVKGFVFAFLKGLYALLLQILVGLKPRRILRGDF